MSKAFTSEETPDDPIVVPPRAPLPPGVPNLVTPRGLELLRAELAELDLERARVQAESSDEIGRQRRLEILGARTAELSARLASATPVGASEQPRGRVAFGASVTLRTTSGERAGEERRFQIVGVDEANPAEGLVAFVSPIARAIIGREVGDEALLRLPRGEESLEILTIEYADGPGKV